MSKRKVRKVVRNYLKTTALHGFKYLCSNRFVDRLGWLLCCGASTCGALVLCGTLWMRFIDLPAVGTLFDDISNDDYIMDNVPDIILCPSPVNIADIILDKLSVNNTKREELSLTLQRLMAARPLTEDKLLSLQNLLVSRNVSLANVIANDIPTCGEYITKCRFLKYQAPCDKLFEKDLTPFGICCVLRHRMVTNLFVDIEPIPYITPSLDFILQHVHEYKAYGCQMYIMYESEENVLASELQPATYYLANVKFRSTMEAEYSVRSTCVSAKGYSRLACRLKCAERSCGCRNPFLILNDTDEVGQLPVCQVTKIPCLRDVVFNVPGETCNCLPPCKQIITYTDLDSAPLNVDHAIDPIFAGVDSSSSIAVRVRVISVFSRVHLTLPSESWITLLGALSGVFNLFMGVGLFSVLEFLFLILVQLPKAVKK